MWWEKEVSQREQRRAQVRRFGKSVFGYWGQLVLMVRDAGSQ